MAASPSSSQLPSSPTLKTFVLTETVPAEITPSQSNLQGDGPAITFRKDNTLSGQTSVKANPDGITPVKESPAKDRLAEKSSAEDILAEDNPVEESPAEESSAEETLAKGSPVEIIPEKKSLVEETPLIKETSSAEICFTLAEEEFLARVRDAYVEQLKNEIKKIPPPQEAGGIFVPIKSTSQLFYSKEKAAVDQILMGISALHWLYNGRYNDFVREQPKERTLQQDSFKWIQELLVNNFEKSEDVKSLITLILIKASRNDDIKAAENNQTPFLDRLNVTNQAKVKQALLFASELNLRHLERGVSPPVCLEILLLKVPDQNGTFLLHFFSTLVETLDADGCSDWTCAKNLGEPAYQSLRSVYDAATAMISGGLSTAQGYSLFLERCAKSHELTKSNFNVEDPAECAMLRILLMGGVQDPETERLFDEATDMLDKEEADSLLRVLNVTGELGLPAVQATHVSNFLERVAKMGSHVHLTSALRYTNRVLALSKEDIEDLRDCIVIERDVAEVVREVMKGGHSFQTDAAQLERFDVPRNKVLKGGSKLIH